MNNKLILGIIAAAGAAYYFLTGKKGALENLKIKPLMIAIDSKKSNFNNLVFNFKLQLINPSAYSVNINKIDLKLFVNNTNIADFEQATNINIPANTDTTSTLQIKTNNLQIITALLNALANGQNLQFSVVGFVQTDLGTININFKQNV
jgi:LEA14-like dessication related protein